MTSPRLRPAIKLSHFFEPGGGPDWQEPSAPWDEEVRAGALGLHCGYFTHIFTVVILHLAVLVSQTLVLLPGIHPVPSQLPQAVIVILEVKVWQAGSLTTQWGDQSDQSDVVTAEFPVRTSSSVGVAVSDSAPDLTELSPLDTLRVVHVLYAEKHGTSRLQREDLEVLYPLPSLSGDQGLTLHLDPVIGVGSPSLGLTETDIILGFAVDFLWWKWKESEWSSEDPMGAEVVTLMYMVQCAADRTILGLIKTPVHSIQPTHSLYGLEACCTYSIIVRSSEKIIQVNRTDPGNGHNERSFSCPTSPGSYEPSPSSRLGLFGRNIIIILVLLIRLTQAPAQ